MAFSIPRVKVPDGASGKRFARLWLIGGGLFLLLISYARCTSYVRPGEAGIKQVAWGFGKGIDKTVKTVGLHVVLPGETMYLFPTSLQMLELTNDSSEAPKDGDDARLRTGPAINIQTNEGYNVQVDVTVLFRIADPLAVMQKLGPAGQYWDSAIIPRSQQVLRRALGELDAEDFYANTKRMQKAREAQAALQADLKDKGLEIVQVFVRRYTYDPRYQNAIEQRKIQDQTVFKNEAEAKAAIATAAKNKIVAEGQANVQVELARGDAEVHKLEASADLYRRKKAAEGDLLGQLAQAKGTELENSALRGTGAENMVGLRMADALRGTQVIVIPTDGEGGMNPLDLRSALKKFDVKE